METTIRATTGQTVERVVRNGLNLRRGCLRAVYGRVQLLLWRKTRSRWLRAEANRPASQQRRLLALDEIKLICCIHPRARRLLNPRAVVFLSPEARREGHETLGALVLANTARWEAAANAA